MCGIYGEFFNEKSLSEKSTFEKANDRNFLRGPDMSGYWSNNVNCQLGFRRLSILDLDIRGNQPMKSLNNKYIIVFNGEIYNHTELRESLKKEGYIFNTTTDTEVLVNCFEFYGIDKTLELIDGMFAIGLYSLQDDQLYLIRDFAGIKPLFYSYSNNDLIFGSSYDQISKHPNNKNLKVNQRVLKTYLRKHYVPAPYGILENTHQLEPGQIIVFSKENILEKKFYWRLPKTVNKEELITDKEEALDYLKKSLDDAVLGELDADVPLGSFLSGGIDSPLITYFAKKHKKDLKAYTIGSDSKVHDESEDSKKYAELIGCDVNLNRLDSSKSSESLLECINNLNEPFADFSIIPTYILTKNSKEYCTVMLSGDGGDELFFGYERFFSVIKNLKWQFIPNKLRYLVYGIDKLFFRNKHVNECFLESNLSDAHEGVHCRFSNKSIHAIFPELEHISEHKLTCYDYKDEKNSFDLLTRMRNAEFYDMMQKTLTKVDRMSMANSLEVRVPFLKKTFIEASLKIDPYLSYGSQKKKQVLKDLLKKLLPNSPINNVKRGFTIPLGKWLREELKQPFETTLFDKNFIKDFQISHSNLKQLWEEHQSGVRDHKWSLFTIYSLSIWHKKLKEE